MGAEVEKALLFYFENILDNKVFHSPKCLVLNSVRAPFVDSGCLHPFCKFKVSKFERIVCNCWMLAMLLSHEVGRLWDKVLLYWVISKFSSYWLDTSSLKAKCWTPIHQSKQRLGVNWPKMFERSKWGLKKCMSYSSNVVCITKWISLLMVTCRGAVLYSSTFIYLYFWQLGSIETFLTGASLVLSFIPFTLDNSVSGSSLVEKHVSRIAIRLPLVTRQWRTILWKIVLEVLLIS